MTWFCPITIRGQNLGICYSLEHTTVDGARWSLAKVNGQPIGAFVTMDEAHDACARHLDGCTKVAVQETHRRRSSSARGPSAPVHVSHGGFGLNEVLIVGLAALATGEAASGYSGSSSSSSSSSSGSYDASDTGGSFYADTSGSGSTSFSADYSSASSSDSSSSYSSDSGSSYSSDSGSSSSFSADGGW